MTLNYFSCNFCKEIITDATHDLNDELYCLPNWTQICKSCFIEKYGGEEYELCLPKNAGIVGGWE